MKELFEDFHVIKGANALSAIYLTPDGELECTPQENGSNRVYLTHRKTGLMFSFESDAGKDALATYNKIWLSFERNIVPFQKLYADFELKLAI